MNRPEQKIPKASLEVFFLSVGYSGFLPKAPGTWGTLVTMPFLYFISLLKAPFFFYLPFLIITTIGASVIADIIQRKYQVKDPQWIVIDESLGIWVAWLFGTTSSPLGLFILFVLFRFFDIVKIWPANFFDKEISHGAGTILDDIVSGIYAGLVFLLINNFIQL